MARKKKSNEDGVSLDSLMDALTNVVAVLILVLLLVQADVKQKVEQFFEDIEPATPEQIEESKKKLEELEKEQEQLDKLLTEEPPSPEDIEEEKRKLALLEKSLAETEQKNRELLRQLDELKKLEIEKRKELEAEQKKTTFMQEEIARLEALLDQTPVVDIPATEVRIPSSKPIPQKAEMYYAIVTEDRVHFIDPFTPVETIGDEFKKNSRKWLHDRVKRGNDRIKVYDQAKIAEHFANFDFKNTRKQQIKLITNPIHTWVSITITPDFKEGGTHIDDLNKKDSTFVKLLTKLRNNKNAVIFFVAGPKSYNTVNMVRNLTDKAGISSGVEDNNFSWATEQTWENINAQAGLNMRLKQIEVTRLKEPPPPPPKPPKPDKPPKEKPKGPPKIGPKID